MMQWIEGNLPLVAGAAIVLVLAVWWLINASRRTRVTLDRTADGEPARRNQALIDAAPVAATDNAAAPVESDLSRLKGVGPKLIAQLEELGVTSVAQVAQWDEAEIARIDAQLGRFAGRIAKDDWVGQARLLAHGDKTAYEERFGKL